MALAKTAIPGLLGVDEAAGLTMSAGNIRRIMFYSVISSLLTRIMQVLGRWAVIATYTKIPLVINPSAGIAVFEYPHENTDQEISPTNRVLGRYNAQQHP